VDERKTNEVDGRSPAADGGAGGITGGEPASPVPRPRARRGTRGGQRRRAAKPAASAVEAASTAMVEEGAGAAVKRRRGPRRKKTSAPDAGASSAPTQGAAEPGAGAPSGDEPADTAARRTRRRRKSPAEPGDTHATPGPAADEAAHPEPTRRRRTRRAKGETSGVPGATATETARAAGGVEEPGEPPFAGDSTEETEAARKRRRRGARGGRRVREREARRAAALAATEGVEQAVPPGGRPADAASVVHEPGAVAAGSAPAVDEGAAPAKRRGRRGGRRKGGTTGVGAAAVAAEGPVAPAERPSAAPVAEVGPEGGTAPPPAAAEAAQPPTGEPERKKARRGGRRGKRAGAEAAPVTTETVAAPASATGAEPAPAETAAPAAAEDDKTEKKARRRDRRRPKAIVRPESLTGADADAVAGPALTTGRRPEVTIEQPKRKTILVTEDPSELRVALVEDGRLAEIYFERPEKRSYLGDIYRGKVENVLSGIDAAFIDFGLDKNGFLYVDEVRTGEGDRRGRRITDVLKPGQDVVVQVMKDPMGSKGARLTMHLSLAGRYVVYVPGGSGVGVSRRLGQGERDRLRELCKELRVKNAGLIVRTAAEGEGLEELRRDVQFLSRLWSRLKKKAETAPIPGLVHKEVDIALEVTRDLFNESVESLIVDDPKRQKAIVTFLEKVAPELVPRIRLHTGAEPLFEAYGIEPQISRALERRVPLPSGGNIVIDHAEALTVIDVNSGRYTSGRGLEDTILKTNLEAAREVVRQLRLRDIGGIIIIDFIDMSHVKNRETVLATLEAELDTDRTKTYVVELSPLGLVEMTRQNTTDGARGILTRSCPSCQGKARTLSEETVALTVERRLRVQSRRSGAKACLVEVNAGVAERLTAGGRLKALEKETKRRIFLEGSSGVAVDAFRFLAEGSVEQVQGQRIPVREGQEVEVELEFALTYSPRDAVGYIDGYMVIVEGGRAFLGQRRKVRIASASRTAASAVLTGGRGGGGA